MSLTSLLKAGKGPVWEWFVENFPQTQRVCADANRELRGGSAQEPCAVPPVPGTDHALAGTAVGYLLSAHMRAGALDVSVARHAAGLLDGSLRRLKVPPSSIERRVVERVEMLRPWEQELDDEDWTTLCRCACILARFEQYFRAGPAVHQYVTVPLKEHGEDLDALASGMASPATLADISSLGRVAVDDHRSIRDASVVFIGPVFAQSLALGGADADVIYDGTLLDFKSTAQPGVIQRHEAWQLGGYLLADTDDRYRIRRVGIAALRRRRSLIWPANELLATLAGGACQPVEYWRGAFADLLAVAPGRRRT